MGAIICLLAIDTFLTGWMLASGRKLGETVKHYTALSDALMDALIEVEESRKSASDE